MKILDVGLCLEVFPVKSLSNKVMIMTKQVLIEIDHQIILCEA